MIVTPTKQAVQPLTDTELRDLGVSVIREVPDAVILADRSGIIRFWNAGATRIFGYAEKEALGQSLDIIIPERLQKRHWTGFYDMMETGYAHHPPERLLAVPALTKLGKTISVEFTVAPVRDGTGGLEGIVAVLRDVTERFQELKRLRAAVR